MKRFLIRYGVFSILAIMFTGIAVIACHYEVRTKYPATLFVMPSGNCRAYVACPAAHLTPLGDTLTIHQTAFGNFTLVIDSLRQEPATTRLFLHPVHPDGFIQSMNGNTFATGYVFVGKERIGDLIRRKFFFR